MNHLNWVCIKCVRTRIAFPLWERVCVVENHFVNSPNISARMLALLALRFKSGVGDKKSYPSREGRLIVIDCPY